MTDIEPTSVAPGPESSIAPAESTNPEAPFPIVGIGGSAGGLEAFEQLLGALPPDTGIGFVVVSHLDPSHASMLAQILARRTRLPVSEVEDEPEVEPNHIYVMPPNRDIAISGGRLRLSPRSPERGSHHVIDGFLRALAKDRRDRAIGVVLSGEGTDGTVGLREIKAEGGITFAQDVSAAHGGMPHSAVATGIVDFVLPPARIAEEIVRIARHPLSGPAAPQLPETAATDVDRVLDVMRQATTVDFSPYRRSTLERRITRRAVLKHAKDLAGYVEVLRGDRAEIDALYQDILIGVTSFFRDPEAFEALKTKVFPALAHGRPRNDPVRFWVLGCSTGEEAYSLAIAFTEYLEAMRLALPFQVFATDLNATAIERARLGIYKRNIGQDVSPERLRRYFVEADGACRVSKAIRDACVFARHDVLTEPPFSHLDLVSCRNLLIYFEPAIQERIVPLLHYALRPRGHLWLGGSESLTAFRELFDGIDPEHKIYVRTPAARHAPLLFPYRGRPFELPAEHPAGTRETGPTAADVHREVDRLLLARYAPPAVLIDAKMEILQFRGETGRYLAPAAGRASLNLVKMLREGLPVAVRGAVLRSLREETPVRVDDLQVHTNCGLEPVSVEVIPLAAALGESPSLLVLFQQPSREPAAEPAAPAAPGAEPPDVENGRLRQELAATREYLRSVIEQQESANEELQSANEEITSANEELQSMNEELETSKEELQSSNEEMATLNDELHRRNIELASSNNDLVNLVTNVQMAIVMLGPDLRIRRFTPMAGKTLNLIDSDVGRPFSDLKLNLEAEGLEDAITDVIDSMQPREMEVRDRSGRWYSLRIRPYRTLERKIDGAVLVLVDVDTLKHEQEMVARQAGLLDQTQEPILIWDLEGGITYWNRAAESVYGYTRDEALGRAPYELLRTRSPRAMLEALRSASRWSGELEQTTKNGESIVVDCRMVLAEEDGRMVVECNVPITERRALEEALRRRVEELARADASKNEFMAMLTHELRGPLAPLRNALQILRTPGLDEAAREATREMMERQVRNISRMVDDLLDISLVTQDKLSLQPQTLDVDALLGALLQRFSPAAEARGLTVEYAPAPEPLYVIADPTRLEQVFENLLDNAAKFTPAAGRIRLTLAAERGAKDEPGWVAVRVIDDGQGMLPEVRERIFELFYQADRTLARTSGGLGIGLTLVKRLVVAHGGAVEAQSPGPGRGSTFTVRLPRAAAPQPVVPEPAPGPAVGSRRILIVDDNVDTAVSLATLLHMEGHEVRTAHDGVSALEAAVESRPEVILLDIGLPGMDGFELARQLRRRDETKQALLVAITGYGRREDRLRSREAGFDAHLVKPVDLDVLRGLLAETAPHPA